MGKNNFYFIHAEGMALNMVMGSGWKPQGRM